jgi:hypothetical protein
MSYLQAVASLPVPIRIGTGWEWHPTGSWRDPEVTIPPADRQCGRGTKSAIPPKTNSQNTTTIRQLQSTTVASAVHAN